MAHVFTIINSSNETVVYDDYDLIPLTTLKHVIKFLPDLGTQVDNNEMQLESGSTGFPGRIVPENWTTSSENHLVLETASDTNVVEHYHESMMEPHVSGDGHAEEEHREIELWNHKLQVLMTRERLNNASS